MTAPAVTLEPFGVADARRLLAWIESEEELVRWAGPRFRWPLDMAQLAAYAATADRDTLLLRARVDADVLGHAELNVDRREASGHAARVLVAPTARGRGLGTAIMRELVRHAFDELGLQRVTLNVFEANDAAISVYAQVGFRVEGRLPERVTVGSERWSALVMAIDAPGASSTS